MNQYPAWKYLLIALVMVAGAIYALPNIYGEHPVVQIASANSDTLAADSKMRVEGLLREHALSYEKLEASSSGLTIQFADTEQQMKAQDAIKHALGHEYVVALNLVAATPAWLKALNASPMYLGLDLRGGVHFLMEVDMAAVLRQTDERYVSDIREVLRNEKLRYRAIGRLDQGGVEVRFRNDVDRNAAALLINNEYSRLKVDTVDRDGVPYVQAFVSEEEQAESKKLALEQNITTLRKRVNELGVAEPLIQQQGDERIVVQLPGVQDPARAKEILGATATLEFRLVDTSVDVMAAQEGRVPIGSRMYRERGGAPILLKKRIIVTGDQIIDASSGIDAQNGSSAVFITLDSKGARRMSSVTKDNIGKPMAVVYIENKVDSRIVDGEVVKTVRTVQEVINTATIRDQLSKRFQITGLESPREARNLSLLLRSGALAAPIQIVEERTVGPSLGQDNIDRGFMSVVAGFILVLIFMAVWYKAFGLVANIALTLNLVLLIAVLSMLQATLTLPGIAGIVLTVGMAVDANVLIFERIREELRNGNSPQASINAGYDKALSTIADANITTLLATVVLYAFGTGPIKGFAVTLSIGILTSMFTSIMGTRAVINFIYGGRKLTRLPI